jgi:SPP1 gp7 family putative phage head morphogenesis protein
MWALEDIIEGWPEVETDSVNRGQSRLDVEDPTILLSGSDYNPLIQRSRVTRIWNLSDNQLRMLWPNLDPTEVRNFAPWATSRSEVRRIAGDVGSPAEGAFLEAYVRRSINAEAAQRPREFAAVSPIERPRRSPRAFRLRPRDYAPVVLGENGLPMTPPRVRVISDETIARQMDWLEVAIGRAVTTENLNDVIGPVAQQLSLFGRRDLERVLAIDLREIPGMQVLINQWRDLNVALIDNALEGSEGIPGTRSSMLTDISRVVEQAHAEGARVEVLAADLAERFDVSVKRAELIARDQTLKLNGQINRHRQKAAGVTHYRWSTSRDARVRDTHRELQGTIQSWDAPPDVGGGRHEHPGGDFQCRCVAIPSISED